MSNRSSLPAELAAISRHLAERGHRALAGIPPARRLALWEETVEAFLEPGSPERSALLPRLLESSRLSPEGLTEGLEIVLGGASGKAAAAMARRAEALPAIVSERLAGVVLAGNLPALAVQSLLPALLLGRPLLLKSASSEPWFAPALVAALAAIPGLEENLRWQDAAAQQLREVRHVQGALDLETIEARAVFVGDEIAGLEQQQKNRARQLIEDLMIAANAVTARFLDRHNLPSLRRVLRSPERWDRIVAVAREAGETLPATPDAAALETFLRRRKQADPLRFPDLSLTIVKLMGSGEYAVDLPGAEPAGHFGLAVRDYTHSTAPNRRYPDVITQRLVKAALADLPSPYSVAELQALAAHCTEQEDDATKIERQVRKSAAALLLEDRIGQTFEGIVTGASEKGTWVRILAPPVEGKVNQGAKGLDVGDRVKVKLTGTDVERGFIDFARLGH